MKPIVMLLLVVVVLGGPVQVLSQTYVAEEEFLGKLGGWADVKVDYGAAGNGTTDDTTAIQNALNALGSGSNPKVLYFPAGTYRITSTLTMTSHQDVALVGADPATTIIQWDGAAWSTMLILNGVRYSRFNRLTFDAQFNGVDTGAMIAISQAWDHAVPGFDTGNEYADLIITDTGYGLYCGPSPGVCAETAVLRTKFIRNLYNGILMGNFNALDMYVWGSYFEDCGAAISNCCGGNAGNWRVYNSYFVGSTTADLYMKNTGVMAFRGNTSLGSKMFLRADFSGNGAPVTLQGNTILDSVDALTIDVGNQGPLVLLDNTIRSLEGATAPIARMTVTNADGIFVGNTFTVSSPISGQRVLEQDTSVVTRASLAGLGAPTLPATPAYTAHTIYEVTTGASAATIQAAIDSAHADAAGSVVHLQGGAYNVATRLDVPANTDIQFTGDTYGTILTWTGGGTGPLMQITGPTKARLSHFRIAAAGRKGIVAQTIDQTGARIFMSSPELREGSQVHLLVDGVDHALVDVRNFGMANMSTGVGIKVIGGTLGTGNTYVFSGATSSMPPTYAVENNGKLLVRDVWYETPTALPGLVNLDGVSGTLTLDSLHMAFTAVNQAQPAIAATGFSGKLTVTGSQLQDRIVLSGDGSTMQVLGLGVLGPNPAVIADYFVDTTSAAADARLLSSRQNVPGSGSTQTTNTGTADSTFLTAMLAQTRGAMPGLIQALGAGITDLRFHRVWVNQATIAVHLIGGGGGGGEPPAEVPIALRLIR